MGLHAAPAAPTTAATAHAGDMLDLLTVGEPLICLTAAGRLAASPSLAKSVGGAEANVAIGLARLGLRAGYVSRVGADPFGDEILRTLRGEGVDVSRVQRSPTRPTGLMVKLRSPNDVRVHYYRQGSAVTELDGIGEVPAARHVHATGITLALGAGPAAAVGELLAAASAMGAGVSLDPNIRLKLWSLDDAVVALREILPQVDDLLLSEAEGLALAGADELDEALLWLVDRGIARVVVRRGAAGAVGAGAGAQRIEVAAEAAGPVVDSVGAGDAFTAGYLFERLRGATFAAAMAAGTWAAGHVVSHVGDYEGLPDRADYDDWRGVTKAVDR